MNELTRTAGMIAAEINTIKEQVRQNVLASAIEIGKRLIEAKNLVNHGEWGTWLENNVDYSERTAQNLMRCFEEYGKNPNPQSIADLSYTKAVALLALPGDLRGELIDSAPELTVRELQEKIEELKRANAAQQVRIDDLLATAEPKEDDEAEQLRGQLEDAEAEKAELETALKAAQEQAASAGARASEAEQKARSAEENYRVTQNTEKHLREKIEELEKREPEVRTETVEVEVVPEAVQAELETLKRKVQAAPNEEVIRLRAGFERLTAEFKAVKAMLDDVADVDAEQAGKYKAAIRKGCEAMIRMLEG